MINSSTKQIPNSVQASYKISLRYYLKHINYLLIAICIFAVNASAQGILTLGIEEVFDDNIYLESGDKLSLDMAEEIARLNNGSVPINLNGEEDDDMITVISSSYTVASESQDFIATALDLGVTGSIFSENTDESRLTIDNLLSFESGDLLIPKPFTATLASTLKSDSDDFAVAQGSIARQSQTHEASVMVDTGEWNASESILVRGDYELIRHDFLNEFTFSSRDDRLEEEGADYLSNGLRASAKWLASEQVAPYIRMETNYQDYTSVTSNDLEPKDADELDRLNSKAMAGVDYQISKVLLSRAEAGADLISFRKDPDSESELDSDSDKNQTSFTYATSIDYIPDSSLQIGTALEQSIGTDIDGDAISHRSITLNAYKKFGERFELFGSGKYLEFENGDSLSSDSTDRFELATSLKYAITQSIALNIGWNFADQSQGDGIQRAQYGNNDYTTNRAFIGISSGLLLQ